MRELRGLESELPGEDRPVGIDWHKWSDVAVVVLAAIALLVGVATLVLTVVLWAGWEGA